MVLLAGCSAPMQDAAPASGSTSDSASVVPAAIDSVPPGVTPDATSAAAEVDEDALLAAHEAAIANQSRTVVMRSTRTAPNGTVVDFHSSTVETDGDQILFHSVDHIDAADVELDRPRDSWTNGSVTVYNVTEVTGKDTTGVVDRGRYGLTLSTEGITTGGYQLRLLNATELRYAGVVDTDDGRRHILVGVDGDTTVHVTDEGVVRSYVYTESDGDGPVFARRVLLTDIGSTTVERPAWATEILELDSNTSAAAGDVNGTE